MEFLKAMLDGSRHYSTSDLVMLWGGVGMCAVAVGILSYVFTHPSPLKVTLADLIGVPTPLQAPSTAAIRISPPVDAHRTPYDTYEAIWVNEDGNEENTAVDHASRDVTVVKSPLDWDVSGTVRDVTPMGVFAVTSICGPNNHPSNGDACLLHSSESGGRDECGRADLRLPPPFPGGQTRGRPVPGDAGE